LQKESGLPLVRLNLIQPFLVELQQQGINPAGVLGSFDLSISAVASKDVFVPANVVYGIIEEFARVADDPHLGVRLGERLDISAWSPFVEAATTAATIAELLLLTAINASKDASSVSLNLETAGGRTSFQVKRLARSKLLPAQVDGFWIGILVSILRRAAGESWEPVSVIVKVCDTRALPDDYFGIRITSGGHNGPSISFPSGWLFLPFAHSTLAWGARAQSTEIPATSITDSIRQTLLPHIAEQGLDATRAADLCGMGKRTLQKRLQEADTTISNVIGELRCDQAISRLLKSNHRVADIAVGVGYPDPAVFSRAFKNWTGLSPQQYRKDKFRLDVAKEPKILPNSE
jgi:AraC-like DNA-binding protein